MPIRSEKPLREVLIKAFVYNLLIAFFAAGLMMFRSNAPSLAEFYNLLIPSAVYTFCCGTLGSIAMYLGRKWHVGDRVPPGILYLLGMAIPCGILGQFLGSAILIQFHLNGPSPLMSPSIPFLHKLAATWVYAPIFVLVTATFMLTIYGFELMKQRLEVTASALKEKELQEERLLKLKAEAELKALQARINPHFLFNTLNSIAALIAEDPRKAEEMTEKLSALFRYTLVADRTERVPLDQELHILHSYIDIEQLRLGPRLRVSVDVEEGLQNLSVPPLLLQPIVENSIKYAVAPREDGGSIQVLVRRNGTRCRFQVIDDGPGFSREAQGTGYALENIRQRLLANYGDRHNFSIARDGGNTIVQFECPITEANEAPVL